MKERNLEYEKKFRAYLFSGCYDRQKEICKNINVNPKDSFMEEVFEIALGDNAINKDYSQEEVLAKLREFSDKALEVKICDKCGGYNHVHFRSSMQYLCDGCIGDEE